jgi:hypothetical protein
MPYDEETKTITTISLDNVRTRKAIAKLSEELVPLCIVDAKEAEEWKVGIGDYADGMKLMLKHDNLSDEEIDSFQWSMNKFYTRWVPINHGHEGITNYIHFLGAGHIADYLFEWRNLCVHSQQGWEALNMSVKTFFFR